MTKADQMKIRAHNPIPEAKLTMDNLKNLDKNKKMEMPLRNQEPIQMERSPPRGMQKKAYGGEEYISGI
jgi:hypothetical protein